MLGIFRQFKHPQRAIFCIYAAAFFYFVFKMFFYAVFVGRFPDEMAHISYIAYLIQHGALIPDFKSMTVLAQTAGGGVSYAINAKMGYAGVFRLGTGFNYLGHPPLYYQLMRLSGGVTVHGSAVTVDILRLRMFSIALAAAAMLLILYIGYSRLGNVPAIHLLYATVCVSVPMLAYDCAGVNNDTLALLGIALILLGLLRFSVKKRDYRTFALLGAGIAVALLAKLVAGMAVCISLLFFLFFMIREERTFRLFRLKYLAAALPFCLLAAAYFLIVWRTTGSVQPTFRKLSPAQFYASGFYVPAKLRAHYDFLQYVKYYWNWFFRSWTGIYSHVKLLKTSLFFAPDQIGLIFLWLLPLPLFLQFRKRNHYPLLTTLLALYMGLLATALIQFLRAYGEFTNVSGYLGGYQSRYYLCMIPFLACAAVCSFGYYYDSREALRQPRGAGAPLQLDARSWHRRRLAVVVFCCAFSALLVYEDFVYFLLHFTDYI